MTTVVSQERVLGGLRDEWGRLDDLLGELDDDEWAAPTPLPGWRVRDVVAHVIGTEAMLAGEAAPEVDIGDAPHVRNDIGRFNESWVVSMADHAPADVLQRLRDLTAERAAALAAMERDEWDAEGFTPAGRDSYGRFMRIRVFDTWLHELDVRDAVGRTGGEDDVYAGPAAELALEELATSMGFVVGKRAGAPPGSRVVLDVTGPAARRILVEVPEEPGARAAVVESLSGPPTVTVSMPLGVFARLAGGRADAAALRDQVSIDGDAELGERIVANLAYTI